MAYTYTITGGASLVEVAVPGQDELVVITPDSPHESEKALRINVPGVNESEKKETKSKAATSGEEGEA